MVPYDPNRFRTSWYRIGGEKRFSLFERTSTGNLITEFNERGEILNQIYTSRDDLMGEASGHLSRMKLTEEINYVDYDGLKVGAKCTQCSSDSIRRELDLIEPSKIPHDPGLQIFVCTNCKGRFVCLTDEYVTALVNNNPHLFEESEIGEREKDRNAFIKEMKQYIISVFAMKKVRRLVFE